METQLKDNQSQLMDSIARHIMGESVNLRIKGSPDKIKVTREAICASKDLYKELNQTGPSLEKIFELVERKNIKAQAFTQITGLHWSL
jgi:hypothetical protein